MQLRMVLEYAAPVERVARMLADAEYLRRTVLASNAEPEEVDVTGDPSGAFQVAVRRLLPTDTIPQNFRAVVGSKLDVRQATAWGAPDGDGRRGTLVLEIAGAPVRLTGTTELSTREGGGTALTYDGEIKAAVPIFGPAIEKAAADAVRTVLTSEHEVGLAWLAENPS